MSEGIMMSTVLEDKSYSNVNLSDGKNIRDIIENYDIIQQEADNGNLGALCLLDDLDRLLDDPSLECGLVKQYIQVVVGNVTIDDNDTILEHVGRENNRWGTTISRMIDKEIDGIVELNNEKWLNATRGRYDLNVTDSKTNTKSKTEQNERAERIDKEKKYGRFDKVAESVSSSKSQQEPPSDVLEMEWIYNSNEERLVELRAIKERDEKQKKELNKLIDMNIKLLDDIKILKDYYGVGYEEYSSAETFNDNNSLSYDSRMDDINCRQVGDTDYNENSDSIKLAQIDKIANEVLTDKQYSYFNFFFLQGMDQKEIAQITGSAQPNISRDIGISIEKIKKSLIN